jgi:hypothetical protein
LHQVSASLAPVGAPRTPWRVPRGLRNSGPLPAIV